jgi:pimeloyl-ACP methyl ester carboxylesterase
VEPFRKYGSDPYRVVVVHGGPGAVGSVAPIARTLGQTRGVLEPFQTATTLDGQIEELRLVVEHNTTLPVTVIGHSWGAWLGALVTAAYPDLVRKLILVGSGPFEEQYVPKIAENRFKRLSPQEQQEYLQLVDLLERSAVLASEISLSRLGELSDKADSYDSIEIPNDTIDLGDIANPAEVYQGVWPQAARLRATGELLRCVATITCPVVAIHGDCDPHPAEGIQQPLAANVKDFQMTILEKCGHTPWCERHAIERFYQILEHELSTAQ